MYQTEKLLNSIIQGDTIDELKKIPSHSIDLIFADPPYFMQTDGSLIRVRRNGFFGRRG